MFLILLILFQYYISLYNSDLHEFYAESELLIEDMARYENLCAAIIEAPGARLLQETSSALNEECERIKQEIESETQKLDEEGHLIIFDLKEAMGIGFLTFTFSGHLLLTWVFCLLAKRKFSFRSVNLIDFAINVCFVIWLVKFTEYSRSINEGFEFLKEEPTRDIQTLSAMLDDIYSGRFYFDYLLASTVLFFWLRLLLMMRETQFFGPMI